MGIVDKDPAQLIRVLRRDEDVFKPESMASFSKKPVTDDHPPTMVDSENEVTITLYEGATYTSGGTAVTPVCTRRTGTPPNSTMTCYQDPVYGVGAATILGMRKSGSGRASGGQVQSDEWLLKQNTTYIIKVNAVAAGWVQISTQWEEFVHHN